MRCRVLSKTLAVLLLASVAAGCYGSFRLTRNLYRINQSVDEKYVRSALTWVLIIPYAVTGFLDFTVFNVIEFWTGESRLEPVKETTRYYRDGADAFTVRLAREGTAVAMTIERYRDGRFVSVQNVRDDGRVVASSLSAADGGGIRATAVRRPDGSVDVTTTSSSGTSTRRVAAAEMGRETGRAVRLLREGRSLFAEGTGVAPAAFAVPLPARRG